MPDDSDYLAIRCDACQARLRVREKLAGTVGQCPECGASLNIPQRPEFDLESPPEVAAAEPTEGYRLAAELDYRPDDHPEPLPAELRGVAPQAGYLEQLGRVRQEKRERPPENLFFSGVFEFPWFPEVWVRWVYLVLGGSAATLIPLMAVTYFGISSGYAGVGLAFFAMPQIWISFWTGSFAAACGLQVFDDTASGSNHISAWPEPNWREWMWPLMYLLYVAFMVFAVAYGVGLALGGSTQVMLTSITLSEYILFPFCLLSVMEANNLAILISPRLLSTLVSKLTSWLVFYLISGALLAMWIGLAWVALQIHPLLVILVNGLLYASITLIWFRLLGRLAWSITHRRSKKPRRVDETPPAANPSPAA